MGGGSLRPIGNSHGNNALLHQQLMRTIREQEGKTYGQRIRERGLRFREQELMSGEEAAQRHQTADEYQATRERSNRRRSMPQQPRREEQRNRELAIEAERNASMSSATAELIKLGIPEEVIRDVINQYV
jgi:hypothetical protein